MGILNSYFSPILLDVLKNMALKTVVSQTDFPESSTIAQIEKEYELLTENTKTIMVFGGPKTGDFSIIDAVLSANYAQCHQDQDPTVWFKKYL